MVKKVQQQKRKKTTLLIILGTIIGVVFLSLGIIFVANIIIGGGFTFNKEQSAMKQYLSEKYNEDIDVSNPVRKGAGLGVPGQLEAYAHSKKNDISFKVLQSSVGYTDDYHTALWSREQTPLITGLVSQSLPNINVTAEAFVAPSVALKDRLAGRLPSYSEIQKEASADMSYIIWLKSSATQVEYENQVKYYEQNLSKVVDYIQGQKPGTIILDIEINVTDDSYKYICSLSGNSTDKQLTADVLSNCFRKVSD